MWGYPSIMDQRQQGSDSGGQHMAQHQLMNPQAMQSQMAAMMGMYPQAMMASMGPFAQQHMLMARQMGAHAGSA